MKNRNLAKILTLVLSLALLIGSVAAINVSAAEPSEIAGVSVEHGAMIKIVIAADANATVQYKWSADGEYVTAKKGDVIESDDAAVDGKTAYYTDGVAYYELAKVAYIKVNDEETTYSVLQFLYAKLYRDEIAKDGEDGAKAAACYEALLALGTASQAYLGDDIDATPLDAYSYIYSNTPGLTVNGGKAYMAAGAATFSIAADSSVGAFDGYQLTPKTGDVVKYAKSNLPETVTISGVVEVSVYTNACVDSNKDGQCDDCSKYLFTADVDSYGAGSGITAHNVGWNGTAGQASSFSSVDTLSTANRPTNFGKGYWFNLVANPTNAADRVIQYNMISTNSNWDTNGEFNSDSYLLFTPTEQVADGDLIVFQFDYYQNSGSVGKNPLLYYEVFENNEIGLGNKVTYTWKDSTTSVNYVRPAQDTNSAESQKGWTPYGEWLSIRVVYSNTNQKSYYYASTDGGVTFEYIKAVSYSQESNLTQVGFYAEYVWQCASTMYIDNVLCVKTNAATFGIELP